MEYVYTIYWVDHEASVFEYLGNVMFMFMIMFMFMFIFIFIFIFILSNIIVK